MSDSPRTTLTSGAEWAKRKGFDLPEPETEPEYEAGRPPVICPKCQRIFPGWKPGLPCMGGTVEKPCPGTLEFVSVFDDRRFESAVQELLDRREVQRRADARERGQKRVPMAKGLTVAELATTTFPARPVVLLRDELPILKAKGTVEIYAARGVGKTLLAETLSLVMGGGATALGLRAPAPLRVLYIDGEMASEC